MPRTFLSFRRSEESSAMLRCAQQANLTLSLRDVPLLQKGEGRFGNAETG